MYRLILLILSITFSNIAFAQYHQAYLGDDGKVFSKEIPIPKQADYRSGGGEILQLEGFPKAFKAYKNNKNFRNVTLQDLDGDGSAEIITAIYQTLYVFHADSLLWKKPLVGVGLYPPSIGDVDGDGNLDIVQVTGGIQQLGGIYVLDKDGNNLPGWPRDINNHWILAAPALADLDNDGKLEIIVNELIRPNGKVHILKFDGSKFSDAWPVSLDHIAAVTPSVGDIDNDGEKDIVVHSTRSMYAFGLDGLPKAGWPVIDNATWFSYQSPILVDLDGDDTLEIVGATHGDAPEFYAVDYKGKYLDGWPVKIPDGAWTFSPPTVIQDANEKPIIFSSRSNSSFNIEKEIIFAFDKNGLTKAGFPIRKSGGTESPIIIADVDDDDEMELVFGSNITDTLGFGFIDAYEMDGSGEVMGFPLKPKGFTYMNGATVADINGDGKMNLVSLTYVIDPNGEDSIYLNAYDLGVSSLGEKIKWGTYKGHNSRDGLLIIKSPPIIINVDSSDNLQINIKPNPIVNELLVFEVKNNITQNVQVAIFDQMGKIIFRNNNTTNTNISIPLAHLSAGIYFIHVRDESGACVAGKFIKL